MCVAGHTSVSPSVCIANTFSDEPQCAGHLGREGEGEGEGERKRKSNGCLKEESGRNIS